MRKCYATILLIIIVTLIYLLVNNNKTIIKNTELFIFENENPIIYDPTYNNVIKSIKKYKKIPLIKTKLSNEKFSKDSFIKVCGDKIRRELVPSNYADQSYAGIDFTIIKNDIIMAPQASNYYF